MTEDCVGCNLCAIVCPVDQCIEMVSVETNHAPLTWEEYATKGMKGYKEVYKRFHS
ncbi:MAG: 4Fe-4S binding protein [Elusimicrobiota bacterium]